tara:strand:- start:243 stop:515 length:273 start_codon:yes stop_codon:yes gene_type:complete
MQEDFFEDIELLNEAMENAYLIVTKKIALDDIYEDYLDRGAFKRFALPFDPTTEDGRTPVIIDMLIDHFTDSEEYERCAELVKLKKKIKN